MPKRQATESPPRHSKVFIQEMEELLGAIIAHEYASDVTRHLSMAYIDEVSNNNGSLIGAAAAAAITESSLPGCEDHALHIQDNLAVTTRKSLKVSDLLICPDEDFCMHFNVTRKTIQIVFDAVQTKYKDFEYNDFLMLIYYLSSASNSLEKVAEVFDLEDEEMVMAGMLDVCRKLEWLRGSAKMQLPDTEYDEDEIAECFQRRTGLPNVLGALGVFKFDAQDDTSLNVLAISDHKHYVRHLGLSNSSYIVQDIVRSSSIYERLLQDHPKHYTYLCPAEGYPSLPQLLPGLQDDELTLFKEMKDFDLRHNQVVGYARMTIKEIVTRFPKLESLEVASPEIVNTAFMLHNFCIETRDISVNFEDLDLLYNIST